MHWLVYLFQSVFYVSGLCGLYYLHGYYENQSYGYGQIQLTFEFLMSFVFSIVFCIFLLARIYKKPSDYFLLLYGLIVIVPYAVLYGIYREEGGWIVFDIIMLLIPFLCILFFCRKKLKLTNISLFEEKNFLNFFLLLSMVVGLFLIFNSPPSASFSLINSYDRRIEARDLYTSGSIIAYASSIVMNGILPLLAFLGAFNKKITYLVIAFLFYALFYYIYGVKAPLLYMVFACVLGYSMRNNNGAKFFYQTIPYIFICLVAFAWFEILIFKYSYLEDYLIRRIFYVGSHLIGAYFNFMDGNYFAWDSGLLASTTKGISMYIGEDFLGYEGANANTNTFVYFLAQYGAVGYVFSIMLVVFILSIFNSLEIKNKAVVFISVLYSILILEQSATTALISSGIFLIGMAYLFSRQKDKKNIYGVNK